MRRPIVRRAPRAVVEAAVRASAEGVRVFCVAKPSAREDAFVVAKDGALSIAVRAQPKDGEANEAIVDVVARALEVPKRDVAIVRGQSARSKEIAIAGVARDDVVAALSAPEEAEPA